MHLRRLFIIAGILLFSCTPKQKTDVLPIDKMTDIITDVQLADAAYKLELLPEVYKSNPEKYYLEILSSHGTDTTMYNKSMQFYAENPLLLKKIYQKVEKNILQQGGKVPPKNEETTLRKAP